MNFGFYILGTPNGYNQYPADNNSTSYRDYIQSNSAESQMTVKRSGQLVHYLYMKKIQESSSDFLGFCLVFNGVYCYNPKQLFELFNRVFLDVQSEGEFIKYKIGKSNFIVSKFVEKVPEIERIKDIFKDSIENELIYDFRKLPLSFKFGNGHKSISINDTISDILAAIAEYEVVHINSNEKSSSELERTQKMLTDLWAEKRKLQQNYNMLLAKKRQYGIVIVLCITLIGFGMGLLAYNKNLQSRDTQIVNLKKEIKQKEENVKSLSNDVDRLRTQTRKLISEKTKLQITVSELNTSNLKLSTKIDQLNTLLEDSMINPKIE
jgi:hypothetical protein